MAEGLSKPKSAEPQNAPQVARHKKYDTTLQIYFEFLESWSQKYSALLQVFENVNGGALEFCGVQKSYRRKSFAMTRGVYSYMLPHDKQLLLY